ncbi:NAD(P)-binding protein [Hypomontagnella monticulosa]|nr:NAD(P)-binding protein [Hypomontagnella monticulosa]
MPRNNFPVQGRLAIVTGGSRGLGLAVARQLAEKGANVVIVARGHDRLVQGLEHMRQGALNPGTQRFHQISADLTSAPEALRVVDEVIAWNSGNPPDIVWCCAGVSRPRLFIDTPVSDFQAQMDANYFTGLYMAHATLRYWLKSPEKDTAANGSSNQVTPPARHIIFTSSFVGFYSFAGYSAYAPAKAALRALSDTLSQEMNLYAAANPHEPPVRAHVTFPASIAGEALEEENRFKADITKKIEESDTPQAPESIAAKSIKALESGQEIITTDLLTGLVKRSMLGGSIRGGFLMALFDWILGGIMALVMIFVRNDMDNKVRDWGRKYGTANNRQDA